MSNDIAYYKQPCDHLQVDDLLLNFVEQRELGPEDVYFEAASFGTTRYGAVKYGKDTRFRRSLEFAPGAVYVEEVDGSITATTDLAHPSTLNNVRLFKRGSLDADRVEIPRIEYGNAEGAVSDATYGTNHRYDTDHYGRVSTQVGGTITTRDFTVNWEMLDEDTIRIYNYDPDNEYYADYTVKQINCPKCEGEGTLNDFVFDSLNRLNLVYNADKVVQEVVLGLIRSIGDNIYFPEYGTNLDGIVGQNPGESDLENTIREQVVEQMLRLTQRQIQRVSIDPDFVTPSEIIKRITELTVDASEGDTVRIQVGIELLDGTKTNAEAEFTR